MVVSGTHVRGGPTAPLYDFCVIAGRRPRSAVEVRTAEAATAVPAGRLGGNLHADTMTLYAVISADAWTALSTTGRLTGRGDLIDPAFIDAYTWIRRAAARRGLGDAWPVWLWAKTTRLELVRQVRNAAREEPGSVLITARIHRSRLLLSEFMEWHSVLNRWPVFPAGISDADFDAYYDRLDEEGPGWHRRETAAPHVRRQLEETWELIFDINMWPATSHWQATVTELAIADVTTAVVLTT
jgi:Domain of unknown function (DUF3841)